AGLPQAQPDVTYTNLETVTLNTGAQASLVNVQSTAAGVNTTINGNASADTVKVLSTGTNSNLLVSTGGGDDNLFVRRTGVNSFPSLLGGAGNDILFVSSAADFVTPGQGSLNGVNGVVAVDAGTGATNRLILDNVTGAVNSNVVLTASKITGLAPATIYYSATNGHYTNGVTRDGILVLASDNGADQLRIESTLEGSTTKVVTGRFNDTFNVGNLSSSLADIKGQLTLDGGANAGTPTTTLSRGSDSHTLATGDVVNFKDQGDNTANLVYDLTSSTLNRTGLPQAQPDVTYTNLETVRLNTGLQP